MSDREKLTESEMDKSDVRVASSPRPRGQGFGVGKKVSMKVHMLDKDGNAVLDFYDFTITAVRKDRAGHQEYQLDYEGASFNRGEWVPERCLERPIAR